MDRSLSTSTDVDWYETRLLMYTYWPGPGSGRPVLAAAAAICSTVEASCSELPVSMDTTGASTAQAPRL
ncbi:hypothetical protein [Streptomyces sp. NPDC059761]|uniref:hypothetical protein n=1 Tax=Streptomyces sp. NPDC059761 TaxID=3346937 RepID=UPI00364FD659